MMHTYLLEPKYAGVKSFYGKAKVHDYGNGVVELQSYNTMVARITDGKVFEDLWGGQTHTTSRHIKEFKAQFLEQ